jgi:hypothetical protein
VAVPALLEVIVPVKLNFLLSGLSRQKIPPCFSVASTATSTPVIWKINMEREGLKIWTLRVPVGVGVGLGEGDGAGVGVPVAVAVGLGLGVVELSV